MMLARLGLMTRAYKAFVGPLDTMSMIPIWSFLMRRPAQPSSGTLSQSRGYLASGQPAYGRILTEEAVVSRVTYGRRWRKAAVGITRRPASQGGATHASKIR